MVGGKILLADEVLTPDSSRFWPVDTYSPGKAQPSYDKQYVRDYLESIKWNKQPPAPPLPEDVARHTSEKYRDAYRALTGLELGASVSRCDGPIAGPDRGRVGGERLRGRIRARRGGFYLIFGRRGLFGFGFWMASRRPRSTHVKSGHAVEFVQLWWCFFCLWCGGCGDRNPLTKLFKWTDSPG